MPSTGNHVKVLPPRPLQNEETVHSLAQWKVNFKQYCKKDGAFKHFLKTSTNWDKSLPNAGFTETIESRNPQQLQEDLEDFLLMLASYLPHGYITDKILNKSVSFESAFNIIEDHYGLIPSQETLCDLVQLSRLPGEPYRQFFDRLVAFMSRHLMPHNTKEEYSVDGIKVPATGDLLSVSMMNMLALRWLEKIHPDLLDIVRTEYSKELRDNTPLSLLVPRIALCVDALLAKYDKVPAIAKTSADSAHGQEDDVKVQKVNFGKRNSYNSVRGRGNQRGGYQGQSKANHLKKFCPGCHYLGNRMTANVNYKHSPQECPRATSLVALLEAEEMENDSGIHLITSNKSAIAECNQETTKSSQVMMINPEAPTCVDSTRSSFIPNDDIINENKIDAMVFYLSSGIEKMRSPTVWALLQGEKIIINIDEGSELNCVDADLIHRLKLQIIPTVTGARSAGSFKMKIEGKTKQPVLLDIVTPDGNARINLGCCLVVKNLGVEVLIGQPGKFNHQIVTMPHSSTMSFKDMDGDSHCCPTLDGDLLKNALVPKSIMRVEEDTYVFPGEKLTHRLPQTFKTFSQIVVTPREALSSKGVEGTFAKMPPDGCFHFPNNSKQIWFFKKHTQLADARAAIDWDEAKVAKLYNVDEREFKCFENPDTNQIQSSFINDVSVDPDKILCDKDKQKFSELCEEFTDIIQYSPGVYNGAYGYVKNTVEFTNIPPPNNKCYVPKYSKVQTDTLAEKMDELLTLGVLQLPENLGITPLFTSPSMLVPKPKPEGGWRLVTDFTQLNNYIRKMPALSPGIEETKLDIAGFRFIACIDLSQFYFQNKVDRESSQYLGVIHPYKGTLVYSVSPMGLRNSSEVAYERLTRIFGDMQRDRKLCRQADALIVGGDTVHKLYENLQEVFMRLRASNMTIKPSKLIICPRSTTLFGLEYCNQEWKPGPHRVNPLVTAKEPTTVKQMRSWLGASKQLSAGLKDYAVVFQPLELMVAGKSSAEKLVWSEDSKAKFAKAKTLIGTVKGVFYPLPTDKLFTYSDFSQQTNAVGGRLEFTRTDANGKKSTYHGGFFSVCLNTSQKRWLPCEAECLAVKLVLDHFSYAIRESKNPVTHYCDNLPTVMAYKRLKQGKFSASARIAAFLTTINSLDVDIVHKAGKDLLLTDYLSRHPASCSNRRCQVCDYVKEQVFIGEAIVNVVTVPDIMQGKYQMPYAQTSAWISLQRKDPVLKKLNMLIQSGQKPEAKKTRGDNTILKTLYNQFTKGDLTINKAGLMTVRTYDDAGIARNQIVVPSSLFPGLVAALHIKLQHPTKFQMGKLIARYFYCPGSTKAIAECVENCHTCISLKALPTPILPETTSPPEKFGTRYAIDVMKRGGQNILFLVELLTNFCWVKVIDSEKATDLLDAIIEAIGPFVHPQGAVIRSDGAPGFQALHSLAGQEGTTLKQLNISLELGQAHHKNKNPCAESIIKEGHQAINRLEDPSIVTQEKAVLIARHINLKIRSNGLTSYEMFTKRGSYDDQQMQMNDTQIGDKKHLKRLHRHNPPAANDRNFKKGDLVMIAGDRSKISPRDTYLLNDVVMRNNCEWAELYKLGSKVTNRPQLVKIQELILLPKSRAAKVRAKAAIRDMIPDIMAIVQSRVPEHSWNYEEMLALFNTDDSDEEEDLMLEENNTDTPGKVEDVTNEEQQEVQENKMVGEEDRRDKPDQFLSEYGE